MKQNLFSWNTFFSILAEFVVIFLGLLGLIVVYKMVNLTSWIIEVSGFQLGSLLIVAGVIVCYRVILLRVRF